MLNLNCSVSGWVVKSGGSRGNFTSDGGGGGNFTSVGSRGGNFISDSIVQQTLYCLRRSIINEWRM